MSIHTDLVAALAELALTCAGNNSPQLNRGIACTALAAARKAKATPDERAAALAIHENGDELEIDEDALASRTEDGTWVQAWVWVPKDEESPE